MKGKLESKPNRESLFRSTVFGPWLDVPYASNDSLLMHYVLQHQVSVSNMCPDFPIIYHIGGHYLQFGRKEFCLITGFRFENVVTPKARKDSPFSDRVFPEKKSIAVKSIKGTDLLKLLRGDRWLTLSDDDAVRVCLLIACELVFMGREDRNVIPTHIMALVEHFHEWNVFFPVNEPDKHWILAELHIATGVVTFYDSLGLVKSNRRSWWRAMKKDLPLRLISYLNGCGVLKSKGICIDTYDISYDFARVPVQGGLFGDCGVWVCICLYRLCRNEQLEVKDPVQAALAYRERMLDYYFDNKVETK
ncbi:phospholipase-like protein [Artemisia annua]|uniref:Phospholipase-like protein n=1 Tax=Artemisia annua TaxID=35608 RepID=A0A2U1L2Q3_ARTAN|nr:phospholipase-like protein [Artemisia annua]